MDDDWVPSSVTFAAAGQGQLTGERKIRDNAANSPQIIKIEGTRHVPKTRAVTRSKSFS
jgi:hypothetical protein